MKRALVMLLVAPLLLILAAAPSAAQPMDGEMPTSKTMEVVGFSSDGARFLLKIVDEQQRVEFEARQVKKAKFIGKVMVTGKEKSALRKAKKKFKIDGVPSDSPENPSNGAMLMGAQKGDKLNIYIMVSETCTKLYESLKLEKNKRGKDKGKPAKATPGQMVWDPNGKAAVVIYHQKWRDTLDQESDFVHSFKVKGYKMKCKAPEGGGQ